MRTSCSRTGSPEARPRAGQAGFTLAEVMVALAIIALASVMLLSQRLDLVREAQHSRDVRTAWILAAQKVAELELDPKLWVGEGGAGAGDFGEPDPEYRHFTWEFQIEREEVPTNDSNDPDEKPREIFRLRLAVNGPALEEPIRLEAFFPIEQGVPVKEEPAEDKAPEEGEKKPEGGKPPEEKPGAGEKQP